MGLRVMRLSGSRRKIAAGTMAVVAVTGAFLAIGPAAASGSTRSSLISLRYSGRDHAFEGRVTSHALDCEGGRKVTLFKKSSKPGKSHGSKKNVSGPTAVGSTITNSHGSYLIKYSNTAGRYYTVVKQARLTGYQHGVCAKGVSDVVTISCHGHTHKHGHNEWCA
jgi:hypothetical protein